MQRSMLISNSLGIFSAFGRSASCPTGPGGVIGGFQTGRFDVVAVPPDPSVVSELEALDGTDVQVGWGPTWEHLSFQFGSGRFERNPDSANEHLDYRRAVVRFETGRHGY